MISLRSAIVRREQPVPQQIARRAGPGFVGIAAQIHAHGCHEVAGVGIAQVDIHIENEVRDLLNYSRDGEVRVPSRWAYCTSQPPQACKLLPCAATLTGVMSRTADFPDSASPLRN